jgi:CCR4-NOT transcription complex subunit 1
MGNRKMCVSFTLKQAVGIFKRFMLINEELYAKVGPRAPSMTQGTSLLKPYLQALGHFIGSLTLAKNRPLLSSELDMKHLLLVGFKDNKNRKLIVTFVCRILKEAQNSQIFKKLTNPWMKGILQIICEIYQFSQNPQNTLMGNDEIKLEIELLFKALQV